MKRILLLTLALFSASGSHAADPLIADKNHAAYCVGVAQVRVQVYEQMVAVPCWENGAQCAALRQVAAAALPRLQWELDAANRALAAYELLHVPEHSRVPARQRMRAVIAGGEREALLCLNTRLPGYPDPGDGDIAQNCRRIAACAAEPTS